MDNNQKEKSTQQAEEAQMVEQENEEELMKMEEGCAIRGEIESLFEADGLTFIRPEDEV